MVDVKILKDGRRVINGHVSMSREVVRRRVKRLKEAVTKYFTGYAPDDLARMMKLGIGNRKTGNRYFTVSLAPVIDCANCDECKYWCYDLQSCCIMTEVINTRAINSALHQMDIVKFYERITQLCQCNYAEYLRLNVGGDVEKADVPLIVKMAKALPRTTIHLFTKNYQAWNNWMAENRRKNLPANLKLIFSRWPNVPCENPYNFPECHVDFGGGCNNEIPEDAKECSGNCTACAFQCTGCHALQKGESVRIGYHANEAFKIQKI